MEICVLNPFFFPYRGGTEKVLFEIYRRLAKRHNITVLSASLNRQGGFDREEIEGIDVIRLESRYVDLPGMPLPFLSMHRLNEFVRKVDANVYHINNRYQYFSGTTGAIKDKNRWLVLTLHNALPKGIDAFTDAGGLLYDVAWGRRVMHSSDLITGISKDVIDTTVPMRDRWKTRKIYNGVDFKRFKARRSNVPEVGGVMEKLRLDGDDVILSNGRCIAQKGQVYLIRAFSELLKDRRDMKLVIIGCGPLERALLAEATRLGISGRVKFVSGIDEKDLPYYYNSGDAFVLPSLWEPASIALLEALASELPTLASRTGGIPEMMEKCGWYAAPRATEEIRERLSYILENKRKAAEVAKRGRALMIKKHDWDVIAKEYEDCFLKLSGAQ